MCLFSSNFTISSKIYDKRNAFDLAWISHFMHLSAYSFRYSTLAIEITSCMLNFSNKAIGTINFVKRTQSFIVRILNVSQNTMLVRGHLCRKAYRTANSTGTYFIYLGELPQNIFFSERLKTIIVYNREVMQYSGWWRCIPLHFHEVVPQTIIRPCSKIWATSWENLFYAICEQQRRRSACASAKSDQPLLFAAWIV